jgi:NhaP-type Na+/H+ or K+/H+ antiporter
LVNVTFGYYLVNLLDVWNKLKKMDTTLKILWKILFGTLIGLILYAVVSLLTSTEKERIEQNTEFIYLEKHRYILYYSAKNTIMVHSEECEICKKNK